MVFDMQRLKGLKAESSMQQAPGSVADDDAASLHAPTQLPGKGGNVAYDVWKGGIEAGDDDPGVYAGPKLIVRRQTRLKFKGRPHRLRTGMFRCFGVTHVGIDITDRTSTRLNSSH